jgi:hypothetical protein
MPQAEQEFDLSSTASSWQGREALWPDAKVSKPK